jgi:hypothetical protein
VKTRNNFKILTQENVRESPYKKVMASGPPHETSSCMRRVKTGSGKLPKDTSWMQRKNTGVVLIVSA